MFPNLTSNFKMISFRSKTLKSINVFRDGINEKSNKIVVKYEEKIQGTFLEKWTKYWKTVYNDYKDVAIDVLKETREKPSKAVLICSSLGIMTYFGKYNPDETNFRSAFLKANNEVILVHPSLQRMETVNHLRFVEQCYNTSKLKYLNLGLFSVMWYDNYGASCNTYESQCSYLKLQYSKFSDRVLDIGFLDTWWILAKKMTDYDINY